MVKPAIFQIVGYKNSGKTTLATKLIKELNNLGLKTVTIKHHGHGIWPEADVQKDTAKHLAAGALASNVYGDGRFILQTDNKEWQLSEQIKLMEYFQPDVILIEGYKQENYPKVFLVREKADLFLLTTMENVRMIIYWKQEMRAALNERTESHLFISMMRRQFLG